MGWHQEYQEQRVQPKGTATYQGTPHTPGAIQHITVTTHHGGQNFAMPEMNATNQRERNDAYQASKTVVPVLDVFGKLDIVFDPAHKIMKINYVMTGDGFPDCEAFLIDEHDKSVFLATHIRYGSATGQLWGEKHLPMAETNIDVEMKEDYSFGDHVTCHKCWDYVDTGSGTIHFEKRFSSGTVDQWNKLHSSRTTQSWMRWINDNKPGYSFDPNNPRYGLFGEYDPNNPSASVPPM